jgi:hypothetical protein
VQGCVVRPVCAGDGRHQPRSKETTQRPLSQVRNGMVGLPGLEPGTSSFSEIDGRALCYPASPQAVPIREWHRDGVNHTPSSPAGAPHDRGVRMTVGHDRGQGSDWQALDQVAVGRGGCRRTPARRAGRWLAPPSPPRGRSLGGRHAVLDQLLASIGQPRRRRTAVAVAATPSAPTAPVAHNLGCLVAGCFWSEIGIRSRWTRVVGPPGS